MVDPYPLIFVTKLSKWPQWAYDHVLYLDSCEFLTVVFQKSYAGKLLYAILIQNQLLYHSWCTATTKHRKKESLKWPNKSYRENP